jgi:transposase InsO family protein
MDCQTAPLPRFVAEPDTDHDRLASGSAVDATEVVNQPEQYFTKARSPQTNGICERFNKTILTAFYQVVLSKQIHRIIEDFQAHLDVWMRDYNTNRTHQGRWCYGKTPMQTFIDMLSVAKEKLLQAA